MTIFVIRLMVGTGGNAEWSGPGPQRKSCYQPGDFGPRGSAEVGEAISEAAVPITLRRKGRREKSERSLVSGSRRRVLDPRRHEAEPVGGGAFAGVAFFVVF